MTELSDSDVYTLIGHAEVLRSRGETEMPAYIFELAGKIARAIGNDHLADRVRLLATPASGGPRDG